MPAKKNNTKSNRLEYNQNNATYAATVTYSAKYTVNLGNYENAQIHYSLTMPCSPNQEDIDATFEKVATYVDNLMHERLGELQ